MTEQIYPKINTRLSFLKDKGKIQHESWVLVKRKGCYYEVYCSESEPLDTYTLEPGIVDSIARFHDKCLRVRYLWVLPSKHQRLEMINKGILKKSINTLNFKERFLLNLRLL